MKKKLAAVLTALILCFTMLPLSAFAADSDALIVDLAMKKFSCGDLAKEGYHWSEEDRTLTLDHFSDNLMFILPDDQPVTVVCNGPCQLPDLQLDGRRHSGFRSKATTLTLKAGEGTDCSLTLADPFTTAVGDTLKVENGLYVEAMQGLNFGSSGGRDSALIVGGTLFSKGEMPCAVNCGRLKIESTGVLLASGTYGVVLNGTADGYAGCLENENGARFHGHCMGSGLTVFGGSTDLSQIPGVVCGSGAENFLSSGYQFLTVMGENGGMQYALTAAPEDAVLSLQYEMVDGAGSVTGGYPLLDDTDSAWTHGSETPFKIHSAISKGWFQELKADGKTVDPANYELKDGSVILELKPEFMVKLSAGTHTLELVYEGGRDVIPVEVSHALSEEWKSDDTCHWHECACGARADEAEHDLQEEILVKPTEEHEGKARKVCSVCGYEGPEYSIPRLPHEHKFGTEWKSDDTHHWHECSCGEKADTAEHTFEWVVDREPTADKPGCRHQHCTVCGYDAPEEEIKYTEVPQTGDRSLLLPGIALCVIAAAGMAALLFAGQKKRRS